MVMQEPVLVTGATGFTGGHLAKRLAHDGYRVRALVRDVNRARHLEACGVELVEGDLLDPKTLPHALEGVHTVYHIAALYRPENVTRKDMFDVNLEGTRHILDASVEAGVARFVHCSTIGVHGDVKQMPATEEAPYSPGDYYQESKTAGEELAIEYMNSGKLPISIFRPGGIYGPGDDRFLKVFKLVRDGKFIMFGSGNIAYQVIYVEDLVEGIILCGTKDEAVGEIFILTGDEPTTIRTLVDTMADVLEVPRPKITIPFVTPIYLLGWAMEIVFKPLGINPPIYRRRVDFFRKNRSFSIDKAKRVLGFQPRIEMRAGLKTTADWYKEQGWL